MNKVTYIKKEDFFKKYKVSKINLVKMGLFKKEDLEELRILEKRNGFIIKLEKFVSYLPFILRHPRFIIFFILPRLLTFLNFFKVNINKNKKEVIELSEKPQISDYILRSSIAAAFRPRRLLEIGTYFGWGAASFKVASPGCVVYTMNPKEDKDSDNPIRSEYVGFFYKKKGLDIKQIWADSTKYDYSKISPVDVVYIDGNHHYDFVYKDLESTSKITKKCIMLDDCVPKEHGNRDGLVFGPWNEGVVGATNDFLKENPNIFKKAYWIKGTRLCVLMK